MTVLRFPIGISGQTLALPDEALSHFGRFRQDSSGKAEAGGQLFARLSASEVVIAKVTGPRQTDRRGRFFYEPDRRAEQREIAAMHKRDLHYIGDWHTHPELIPVPSGRDARSIDECTLKSTHGLNGFLLILVGTAAFPDGLRVSLHSGKGTLQLNPAAP
jgi:integrative and conjugative element protein (TIGR02256 family)